MIRWHVHVKTAELLQRDPVKPLNVKVRRRRWMFIDHALRQNPGNMAGTRAPEGKKEKAKSKNVMAKGYK